ncbi:MAG: hypothetical protein OEQ18_03640 [Gammaproteobacteria bacterium]|nr:hypothetical protein [Gammaproteobacteria bacterium]
MADTAQPRCFPGILMPLLRREVLAENDPIAMDLYFEHNDSAVTHLRMNEVKWLL